jgi:uncharacterized protein YoxC
VFDKVTIKDYMEQENISRTTVDNRIKNGDIESVKEGRNRYIKVYKVCKPEFVQSLQTPLQTPLHSKDEESEYIKELKATIKEQKKELKQTKKELKREIEFSRKETQKLLQKNEDLNQIVYKEKDESIQILKQYIGEVKLLTQAPVQKDEEIIEVSDKKKKKKSKKSSKKSE